MTTAPTEVSGYRRTTLIAISALATPLAFHLYWITVYQFLNHPFTLSPITHSGTWVYAAMLVILGATVSLGWRGGLRMAPVATGVGLLAFPWFTLTTMIGGPGYPAVVFVGALLVTVGEWVVREPSSFRLGALLEGELGRYAVASGFLHFLVGFGLQLFVRRLYFVDAADGFTGILLGGLIYMITGLILFAAGAVPIIGWHRARLITPSVVTGGWLAWGLYAIWMQRARFPLGEFSGIAWTASQPHPDYMFQSPGLIVALLVVAGIELFIRRTANRVRAGSLG